MDAFSGSRAILSGPAGGVVGYAVTTYRQEGGQPVIGFDMGGECGVRRRRGRNRPGRGVRLGLLACPGESPGGCRAKGPRLAAWLSFPDLSAGTSTDVSRYAGEYEHIFEATTAGISIQAPQLDINTVAAGGGSRLFFR